MAGIIGTALQPKLEPVVDKLQAVQPTDTKKTVQPVKPVTTAAPATTPSATPAATTPAAATPSLTPVTTAINPTTDTVQGQIANITAKDSPLNEMARTRAAQGMNQRGLINSSMALQAGEAAVLESALPIAAADAATYGRNREVNQATQNEFGLQNLRGDQATKLAEIENANQRLLQANQSAMALFGQSSASMSAILANPDIPAATKDKLIARELQLLENGLAVSGGITGIPGLKNVLKFPKSMKGAASSTMKVERPKSPKPGETYTDENGKKWKWISLGSGKGEWKAA